MRFIAAMAIVTFMIGNVSAKDYNILDFGAKSSLETINIKAIQLAIDLCSKDGGNSTVIIHNGTFITGTLFMKSNVTINMEAGSVIYGSADFADYANVPVSTEEPQFSKYLFYVEGADNIKLIGDNNSEINGRGYFFKYNKQRPKLFRIEKCQNVDFENIHLFYSGHGKLDVKNRIVPEDEARYPEQSFFGVLPSYGIYLRHVKGLRMKDVTMELRDNDSRPAMVMDDVVESRFENLNFDIRKEAESGMVLINAKDIILSQIKLAGEVENLVEINEDKSSNIRLENTNIKALNIKNSVRFTNNASDKVFLYR